MTGKARNSKVHQFSRRTLITGAATSLASLGMWKMLARRASAADDVKRVIIWWLPEGCAQQAFWPGGGPGALDINMSASISGQDVRSRAVSINGYRSDRMGTYCLQPLKSHEADLTLVSGFRNGGSDASDPHKAVMDSSLTGRGGQAGRSIDQILGDHLQGDAPFSAVASTMFARHATQRAGDTYLHPVRLAGGGAGSPTWNPVTTYNQIFPSGIPGPGASPNEPVVNHDLESRLRALGAVRGRLNRIRCEGGALAQSRMEAYLDSIERIEAQTDALIAAEASGGNGPANVDLRVNLPDGWGNTNNSSQYWTRSENFGTLSKIQMDTAVAALALDRTRSLFLQFSGSGGNGEFGAYDGRHYNATVQGLETKSDLNDHEMAHDHENQEETRDQARVYRWYYEQLAYLVDRLKEIPDGTGTLFDSTLIVTASEFGSYNHRQTDIPYMLVGNPGGAFNKGVYMDVHNGDFRNHSDFWLAVAQGLGMNIDRFADSTNPFRGILA